MDIPEPKNSLKMVAIDYLKEQIMCYNIIPGTILTEESISKQLGISRTPIREALVDLQYEGYIDIIPRKYIKVREISLKEQESIFEARLILEPPILRKITKDMVSNNMPMLLQFRQQWTNCLNIEDNRENCRLFLKNDIELHRGLISIYNNQIITNICINLLSRSQRFWYLELVTIGRRMQFVAREHLDLIGMLLSGDFEGAATLQQAHIQNSYNALSIVTV